MTEWETLHICRATKDGIPREFCETTEAEAKLAAAGYRVSVNRWVAGLEAERDKAVKDRDRDWHINDGKIAELEAEIKRLKDDMKPVHDFERQDEGRDSGE